MKSLKEEIVDNDEKLNIVKEIKFLIEKIMYNGKSIKDLKKNYPDKFKNLEEILPYYIGKNDLKLLKMEFPDKWKDLTKNIAYPYEFFIFIADYQKPIDSLNKEDFFSKLKNDYPSDEEIERTKEIIKRFNIKNGEELTQIYFEKCCFLNSLCFSKIY